MIAYPNTGHRYAGLIAELRKSPLTRCIDRLKRAIAGGVWVLHDDIGWVRARWTDARKAGHGMLYDERGHGYHGTLLSIVTIEDYT